MTEVVTSDAIFAWMNKELVAVGHATGRAEECDRPDENPFSGKVKNNSGWKVPVWWRRLVTPVSLDAVGPLIEALKGVKYSPINKKGTVNNITLAEFDREVGENLLQFIESDPPPG
jgi:hypothetical protein